MTAERFIAHAAPGSQRQVADAEDSVTEKKERFGLVF